MGWWEEGEGRKGGHNLKPVPLRQNGRAEREGTGPEFLSELAVSSSRVACLAVPTGPPPPKPFSSSATKCVISTDETCALRLI